MYGVFFDFEFHYFNTRMIHRCVFATATYRDTFAMQCSDGIKIHYKRGLKYLEIYNSFDDPYEENIINKYIDDEVFVNISKPLIEFLSYGRNSYARNQK